MMVFQYTLSIILYLVLLSQTHANNQFICPLSFEDPNKILSGAHWPIDTKIDINIKRTTTIGSVCNLFWIAPTSSSVDITQLSRNSLNSEYNIVPVARSYNKNTWERVEGAFKEHVKVKSCSKKKCKLQIQILYGLETGSFILMRSDFKLKPKEKVARFFEKTTFGGTVNMINSWNYNMPTIKSMAMWTKNQMNSKSITITSHREYFRKRYDYSHFLEKSSFFSRPRHPCDKFSRWRKYAFTSDDYQRVLNVKKISSGFLLSVDGIPRTIVKSFKLIYDTSGDPHAPLGDYDFCWWTEEKLEGYVSIAPKGGDCDGIDGGNPEIFLKSFYFNDPIYKENLKLLMLPSIKLFSTNNAYIQPQEIDFAIGESRVLKKSIMKFKKSKKTCASLPKGDYSNLYGKLPNNQGYMIYAAHMVLDNNLMHDPLPDGGGETYLSGAKCPNVAKNFLNIDSCKLSTSKNACSDKAASLALKLNDDTNRQLYALTGRYIYTIDGLRLDHVPSPCELGVTHRWVRVSRSQLKCKTSGVQKPTRKSLREKLDSYDWDGNKEIIDVDLQYDSYDGACEGDTKGMFLWYNDQCWKHSHPDSLNVYDFTYWTIPSTHPGNAVAASSGKPNPIKNWANQNLFRLIFPSQPYHNMAFWESNKQNFDYIGKLGEEVSFADLPSHLRIESVANAFSPTDKNIGAVVVCGSRNEVSNIPSFNNMFVDESTYLKDDSGLEKQKKNIWAMVVMDGNDQLRQRVAWALSQILVVTPNQIEVKTLTEIYLNYYDIFVRHAFGNYYDILKEVTYSPMMAEMLSFLNSKSLAYIFSDTGEFAYPDENFARELMQLFSIGIYKLNIDGTIKRDKNGKPIPSYQNSDIQTFARAWTGFTNQIERGNIEHGWYEPNRMDPMRLVGRWRDAFPKMELHGNYIGDKYPLCSDLQPKHFLSKGAEYRLLGSHPQPDLHSQPDWWLNLDKSIKHFKLDSSKSKLFMNLCNESADGSCNFNSVVKLNKNLSCVGSECKLDNLRVVQVQANPNIYYEYIRPMCVEHAFYQNAKKISKRWPYHSMCGNPTLEIAMPVCCDNNQDEYPHAHNNCEFTAERVSYFKSTQRCKQNNGYICDWYWVENNDDQCTYFWPEQGWYWSNKSCTIKAKVRRDGMIALVHEPNLDILESHWDEYIVDPRFDTNNKHFFKVNWNNDLQPNNGSSCNKECVTLENNECLCNFDVVEGAVFNSIPDSVDQVVSNLHIGSFEPDNDHEEDGTHNGITIYHKIGSNKFDAETIFGVIYNDKLMYLKNMRSDVFLRRKNGSLSQFKFRNPPQFLNHALYEARDAAFETDAILEYFFRHENTAPFLAKLLIKRFGMSNPSPRFVQIVATAFKNGSYIVNGVTFGDGRYGNLAAMIAAIVLDRESTSEILDADPSTGSLKEPLIKLISFMRAMEFKIKLSNTELNLPHVQNLIGQMPHAIPNVFSFFSPEYAATGQIDAALLKSPEAQILTTPKIIGFINGIISLVDLGLTDCFGGFGSSTVYDCDYWDEYYDEENDSRGSLTYQSTGGAAKVIDELSMLLTSGRLNQKSRNVIKNAYNKAPSSEQGLRIAQKLIATTPEFHSTGIYDMTGTERPDFEKPPPSSKPYKAIVYVLCDGGMDSHNILVPHSNCAGGKDLYEEYKNVRGDIALNKNTLHQIDASSSSQPCNTYGIHGNLPYVKDLYDSGDLLWIANMGVLQQYVTKDDWYSKTSETALFAHNTQVDEVSNVDIFERHAGRGILGRLVDVSNKAGFSAASTSIDIISKALFSKLVPLFVVAAEGMQKFNPISWSDPLLSKVKALNKESKFGSSLFSEVWSKLLISALGENDLLFNAFDSSEIATEFPDNDLGPQFQAIAKLIKTKEIRGADRDVFYAEVSGFDTHDDIAPQLNDRTETINSALQAFVSEMKNQNKWNDVTVVFVSEFARTLTGNSGKGSDHAWGGNYFVTGGSVKGSRIIGEYPADITENSALRFEPGILIPTLSWDSLWNGIAQWFGISNDDDLDEVLPNRNAFSNNLFSESDLFV